MKSTLYKGGKKIAEIFSDDKYHLIIVPGKKPGELKLKIYKRV